MRFSALLKNIFHIIYSVCAQVGLFTAACFGFIIYHICSAFKPVFRSMVKAFSGKKTPERGSSFAGLYTNARAQSSIWGFAGSFTKGFFSGLRRSQNIWIRIFNHVAPVGAALVLLFTVLTFAKFDFVLEVTVDGQHFGYVNNEEVFNEAVTGYKQSVAMESETEPLLVPEFHVRMVSNARISDAASMSRMLINNSSAYNHGYGFYAGDVLLCVSSDQKVIYSELENILGKHKTINEGERVTFIDDIKVVPGLYPAEKVKTGTEIVSLLNTANTEKLSYTVDKGDTVESVASKLHVTPETLKEQNNGVSALKKGDVLTLSTSLPLLSVKTVRDFKSERELDYKVVENKTSAYDDGYRSVKIKGQKGKALITTEQTIVNGVLTAERVVNTQVLMAAVDEEIEVGTKRIVVTMPATPEGDGVAKGNYVWPVGKVVEGRTYVSAFWGDNRGHRGLDIAAPRGTDILAADGGTVVGINSAGSGYGLSIVIQHDNGIKTLYAHCNAIGVQIGQKVTRGQVIGKVGSTGRSTGNHLHFEILINDVRVNPAPYLNLK